MEREFHGRLTPSGQVIWDHPEVVAAYRRKLFASTDGFVTGVFYPMRTKRSDRQNRALHAMLAPWARERGWNPDHLKLKMLEIAFGTIEEVEPITNRIVTVAAEPHSSKLDVAKFCHLIEEVLRVAAEDDFWIDAPDEYLRAKREAEKKAAQAQRRAA